MRDIRDASQLNGLWAAMPTPWTVDDRIDENAVRTNVERYAAAGVDGVYTTDSDGEFYALELAEFTQLIQLFSKAMIDTALGIQVGVTWTNTRGIIDRMKVCLDHGISAMHICFPYWMPMRRDEMKAFWETLAEEVPEARWIHYNSMRGHLVLNGGDYRWLKQTYPEQFIGTKLCTSNLVDLTDCMRGTEDVAHFVTDFVVVPAMAMGAKGCYSFWVNTLPQWMLEMINLAQAGEWQRALQMQKRFLDWENEVVAPVAAQGYLHGIIGKARGELMPFLDDNGRTRSPYTPVPERLKQAMREGFEKAWPEYAGETAALSQVK